MEALRFGLKRYGNTVALTSRTSEIERLVLLIEKLQRMPFYVKNEKVLRQIDQLDLTANHCRLRRVEPLAW